MAVNRWRAVLTDMAYVPLGELQNASERSLSMSLSRTDTASFSIRTDNPFANVVQSLEAYLKLYRNNTLMFFGLLQTAEESASAGGSTITATAAGPGWVFPHRYPVQQANAGTPIFSWRAQIAATLLSGLNGQYVIGGSPVNQVYYDKARGETGIGPSTAHAHGGTITYPIPPYKPFSEILSELSSSADGFDWRVLPFENWSAGGPVFHPLYPTTHKTGIFTTGAPIGTSRPEAIFEFGAGRSNISSYTRTRSREMQANGVIHLLNGQPEDNPVKSSVFGVEDLMRAGVLEDIVQADLTDYTLRSNLVSVHREVRNFPRHVVQWTPTADYGDDRLPRFGIDYDLGDLVTGRAKSNDSVRFNGQFRVWGVEFAVDAAGVETPTIMLEFQS